MTEIIWHYGLLFVATVALALSVLTAWHEIAVAVAHDERERRRARLRSARWPKRPRRRT